MFQHNVYNLCLPKGLNYLANCTNRKYGKNQSFRCQLPNINENLNIMNLKAYFAQLFL